MLQAVLSGVSGELKRLSRPGRNQNPATAQLDLEPPTPQ
jgi:hypothetical protein